ncbi:MAG: tryptophan--tRNA ligase [Calditrichaeota bacterium]|nr:tryptophan--tRNA ligase [Calditrichota bacterium]
MHIGNYFGAVANWVRLQDEHECIYGVVDLHAMTMPFDPQMLRAQTRQMALDLLACGIDPERVILFIQSLVPEHTELYWIFNCLTPMGDLSRMTQFKEKSDQLEEQGGAFISAGLFGYPVLQAADITIYRAERVPVGRDQEQHLELAREIVRRFNGTFGEYFPEPGPLLTESPKVMSLADPVRKMSKSLGDRHYIGIFESEDQVRRKVKSAVTDVGGVVGAEPGPGVANMLQILRSCGKDNHAAELRRDHDAGTLKYVHLKSAVAEALVELTSALIARREALAAHPDRVEEIVQEGSKKARAIARETLDRVRDLTGLPPGHA